MNLKLDNRGICEVETGCLVIPVVEGGSLPDSVAAVDKAAGGAITSLLEDGDIAVKPGKTTLLHRIPGIAAERVLAVGMGKPEKLNLAKFDSACMAAAKVLRDHPVRNCHSSLHEVAVEGISTADLLRQSALALRHGNYLYTVTKQRKDDSPEPL